MKVSDELAVKMLKDYPYDYYHATKEEWKREERDRVEFMTREPRDWKEDDAIIDMIIN
jgi:hypothetical protein